MLRQFEIAADPRTVARNVSGIFEAALPQLAPAVVSHFNRSYSRQIKGYQTISVDMLERSDLQRAMLFELALVVAEQWLIAPGQTDWKTCLRSAGVRQQKYFDSTIPDTLLESDREVASLVARNVLAGLQEISSTKEAPIVAQPRIPGFRWIATGVGDFATECTIIEVKCSSKRFSTADYRQIVMYWLLNYIEALEIGNAPWRKGVLLNPRLGSLVEFSFDNLIPLIAFERSVSSVVETFKAIINEDPQMELSGNWQESHSWPNA